MGADSSVFVVPESDRDWKSDPTAIRWILEYLGCDRLHGLAGYARPYCWDDPEGGLRDKVISGQTLTIDEGIAALTNSSTEFVFMELRCDLWRERFCAEVESMPEGVSDDYLPRDVGLYIGPFSISDRGQEFTAGIYRLGLAIFGYGMPCDVDLYLKHFGNLSVIRDLIGAFSREFGIPWNLVMWSTY